MSETTTGKPTSFGEQFTPEEIDQISEQGRCAAASLFEQAFNSSTDVRAINAQFAMFRQMGASILATDLYNSVKLAGCDLDERLALIVEYLRREYASLNDQNMTLHKFEDDGAPPAPDEPATKPEEEAR